ncbi:MAG: PAS domain S-box protein [Alphaproteobacteria bacterium]|nr:MAG: PAS domain S-box protein [Alphaproteobacteria bacterium]
MGQEGVHPVLSKLAGESLHAVVHCAKYALGRLKSLASCTISSVESGAAMERVLAALDAADAFAWEWDLDTGAARRWGDPSRIVGPASPNADGFYAAVHPDDRAQARAAMDEALANQGRYEAMFRLSWPGGAKWVRDVGQVILDESGKPVRVVGVCFDDTRRHSDEERFQAVFAQTTAAICHYDPEGRYLLANGALVHILGTDPTGCSFTEFIHPDDLAEARLRFLALAHGASAFVLENRFLRPDGGIVWLRTHLSAVRGPDGAVQVVQGVATDITDLVNTRQALQANEERLEAMVQERTREIESFSYSVSHDLRTPARTVMATSRMLLEDYGEQLNDDARALLRRQSAAGRRMGELIDDLLGLSRVGQAEIHRREVDVTALVRAVAHEVLNEAPEGVRVEVADEACVSGDPQLVRLALQNLLENAAKFTKPGLPNVIRVSTRVTAGETILTVADSGIGFDPVYAEKIFQPFERLHRDEDIPGTGIGLANVRRIAERHGGKAWAESKPGEGARFHLSFPA